MGFFYFENSICGYLIYIKLSLNNFAVVSEVIVMILTKWWKLYILSSICILVHVYLHIGYQIRHLFELCFILYLGIGWLERISIGRAFKPWGIGKRYFDDDCKLWGTFSLTLKVLLISHPYVSSTICPKWPT